MTLAQIKFWIEQQLHPEAIPDRAVEARIAILPTMKMSNAQIVKTYYEPVLMARKRANAEAKDGDVDKKDVRRELMLRTTTMRGQRGVRRLPRMSNGARLARPREREG